ncbi:MAG: DUF4412 domain-containing protein, partial [Candidatus Dadabacteria bacterium]|nr:DUF4412 domain-containing protein [Candidatus Dadabacteria bacterium]NIQ14958.1 DUF4412 domain-containing protein [Candidatus Dadabacteria bacterium]
EELPSDERAKVEKMLKEKGFSDSQSKKVSLSIENTNEVQTISGYECSVFKIFKNRELIEELCLSNSFEYGDEVDIDKLSSFMSEFKKLGQSLNNDIVVDGEDKYLKLFAVNGYPLKTVDYTVKGSVFIEEIKSITRSKIDNEEFYPPENFEKKSLKEMMTAPSNI